MHTIFKSLQSLLTAAAPKPVAAAWPAPSARPDTPALRAFAQHVRMLASARRQWHGPDAMDTTPGVFGLLVESRRNDN